MLNSLIHANCTTDSMKLSQISEKLSGLIDMARPQPANNTILSILIDTIIGLTEEPSFIKFCGGSEREQADIRTIYETIRDYSKDVPIPIKEEVKQELIKCLKTIVDRIKSHQR